MKIYAFFIDILLLTLVSITGFLLWSASQYSPENISAAQIKTQQKQESFDAFAKEIVSVQYNNLGEKKYQLAAPSLRHYNKNNLTLFNSPVLDMYNDGDYPWIITADHARSIEGLQEIKLTDNVQVSGAQTKDYKGSLLTSDKISYYPDSNLASTKEPVKIIQPGVTLNATGMNVFFDENKVELLSEVNGQYDPKSKRPKDE